MPDSPHFFLLVSSSSCSASVLVYFSKHLFAIARALLNSVLSLLALEGGGTQPKFQVGFS